MIKENTIFFSHWVAIFASIYNHMYHLPSCTFRLFPYFYRNSTFGTFRLFPYFFEIVLLVLLDFFPFSIEIVLLVLLDFWRLFL